jgi:endonuclease III
VTEPSRLERIAGELQAFYGLLPSPPSNPFALFVWDVLSFHTTPQKRDLAFAALKRNRSLTPDAMSKLAPKKLEDGVKLAGPYAEQRLRALRAGVSVFQRNSGLMSALEKPLPLAEESLGAVPQMADGGADRMLLFAGAHRVLPMDAGTRRVLGRLGYGDSPDAELPHRLDVYRRVSLYLSHHAQATCTASDPHCAVCPLLGDCPTGESTR